MFQIILDFGAFNLKGGWFKLKHSVLKGYKSRSKTLKQQNVNVKIEIKLQYRVLNLKLIVHFSLLINNK